MIKKKLNLSKKIEQVLKNMIEYEKTKQYEQFSQVYFNKIKLNLQIENY